VKLPRDLSGHDLAKLLGALGYVAVRQRGSHLTLTTQQAGEHHLTIPLHDPLKPGTLNGLLRDVAAHHGMTRDALMEILFS
jgi:predicted RNA binding protein YcfA (HicA-like mRNA interferase family)